MRRTNTSATPLVSPPNETVRWDTKATEPPSCEMDGAGETGTPPPTVEKVLTLSVFNATKSRRKTSQPGPQEDPAIRSGAVL
jgi:hypothetical protein